MKRAISLVFALPIYAAAMTFSPGYPTVGGSAANTWFGTGATLSLSNGLMAMVLTNSFPDQTSGWSTTISKDYTLAQSTSGTNGNAIFNTSSGDFFWLTHNNCASGASGCIALPTGLHQDDSFGLFLAVDVATPHPIKIYHWTSTMSEPMIELEAETDWRTDYYTGLTPSYSGTFSGHFLRARKRNVTQAAIDNDGSFYSYADSGNDYTRFYTIADTAGVLRSNLPVSRWDEVTGSYIDFSPSLAGNLLTVVPNTGDVTVTPSGGDYTLSGSFHPIYVATQTIAGGNTVAADACGSIKNISSAGAVTTNTTNTFTALSVNQPCIMNVVNVGSNNITLDNNANFKSPGGADVVMTGNDSIVVGTTDGTVWYAISALVAN